MRIAMFVIFLIADLIVLLACKFTYENKHNYVDGMLIGVHIPSSEVTNPKVQEIILLRELESVSFAFLILNYLQLYG